MQWIGSGFDTLLGQAKQPWPGHDGTPRPDKTRYKEPWSWGNLKSQAGIQHQR